MRSAPLPACYDTVEIFAYNRVVAGLDYGGQEAQSLLTFEQRHFDLSSFSNIAIGFEYDAVIEQLHTALDNDFPATFADVTQLAEPMSPIPELRAQVTKIDRKYSLQQNMAATSDCFVLRKTVKPLSPCVPEFDWTVQTPGKHGFVG